VPINNKKHQASKTEMNERTLTNQNKQPNLNKAKYNKTKLYNNKLNKFEKIQKRFIIHNK
jgi:hypothetical protein